MITRKKILLKFIAIMVLTIFCLVLSWPKPINKPEFLSSFLKKFKINLGLDLQGGIQLIYQADVASVPSDKIGDAMQGLQDVIERRVNAFGVAEPLIEISRSGNDYRLIVELAGVSDIESAKAMIKETPFMEFKKEAEDKPEDGENEEFSQEDKQYNEQQREKAQALLNQALAGSDLSEIAKEYSEDPGSKEKGGELDFVKRGSFVKEFEDVIFNPDLAVGAIYPQLIETPYGYHIIKKLDVRGEGKDTEVKSQHVLLQKKQPLPTIKEPKFESTGLTGKNLKAAQVVADPNTGLPQVAIEFDREGTEIFAELTKENVGKRIAIYLDGNIISAPVVQTQIIDGHAVITGDFSLQEAKKLTQRLNEGAIPVPITLISQQAVGATLGKESLEKSLEAGLIGLIIVCVFMIFYYRLLGLVAAGALVVYSAIMISIFKLSSVSPWAITLTLAGIAGFIISVGMAVDANILIFERTKEELQRGRSLRSALDEGFLRAWPSIRDSNISTILTSLILYNFGTGAVKGFAGTLLLGVLISMFTAIVFVRIILLVVAGHWAESRSNLFIYFRKRNLQSD